MKKSLLLILISCFGLLIVSAQFQADSSALSEAEDIDYLSLPEKRGDGEARLVLTEEEKKERMTFGAQVNTQVGVGNHDYFASSLSFNPHVKYKATKQLSFTAGASFSYGQYTPLTVEGTYSSEMLPMTQLFVYGSGSYQVNPKLVVSASAYKNMSEPGESKDPKALDLYDNDFQGVSFGMSYQVNPKLSLHFQVNIEEGHNPYRYYNPYDPFNSSYRRGMYSPFNSPFYSHW